MTTVPQKEPGHSIWIAGEAYPLAGNVPVKTFVEEPEWDFMKFTPPPDSGRAKYWFPRRVKIEGEGVRAARNIEELRKGVELVVLHTDGMLDAAGCHRVLLDRGLSTHFMVDWDGTVIQSMDPINVSLHAGEQNLRSVGIDLNNDLPEVHKDKARKYPYRPGPMSDKKYRRPRSEMVEINGSRKQSYGYTDAQYISLVELLKVLCDVLDIPKQPPLNARSEIIYTLLEDMEGFQGVGAHWHFSPTRWDPGPGFDWQRVYHALRGEHNSFPIVLDAGQNVADLLAPTKVKAAAQRLYEANEQNGDGFYPMGVNQNWHGGLHIPAPKGTEVHALMDGVLVAARVGNPNSEYGADTPLGSNNFVLLRHDIPIPKSKPLRVFSLYMHLDEIKIDPVAPAYNWLQQTFRVYRGEDEKDADALDMSGAEDLRKDEIEHKPDAVDPSFEPHMDDRRRTAKDIKPYLDVGYKLAGLKRGAIALFDVEPAERQIRVKAGEVVGAVGPFGGGSEQRYQVHVEVFADGTWKKAVDLGVHARYWVEIEEDVDSNLRVETDDILNLFQTSTNRRRHRSFFRRVHRDVLPSEVAEFFALPGQNQEAKEWLRKAVTRHVSEWSDQVDWVSALAAGQTWSEKVHGFDTLFQDRGGVYRAGVFTNEIRKFLPFIWLNADVAEHIGLKIKGKWNGVLYHFHPIHFMLWITYHSSSRVKALSVGKTAKQLRKELKKHIAEENARRLDATAFENAEDFHETDDDWLYQLDDVTPDDVLKDYMGRRPDQDEWPVPERD